MLLEVRSADGTPITAEVSGQGPPLVLVHGIGGVGARWRAAKALEADFTLIAVDRRGRGQSGDGAAYSIDREVEDLVAIRGALGRHVFLLGHSFGGLLSLEAASRTEFSKLLVYEPYGPAEALPAPSAASLAYAAMVDDPAALLERFLREVVQMTPAEIDRFRASAAWAPRLAAAPTIPRELAAVEQRTTDLTALASRGTPTRLLLGEKSPAFLADAVARFHRMVPQSDVVVLPGQGHVAMDMAPALFEHEVRSFFLA